MRVCFDDIIFKPLSLHETILGLRFRLFYINAKDYAKPKQHSYCYNISYYAFAKSKYFWHVICQKTVGDHLLLPYHICIRGYIFIRLELDFLLIPFVFQLHHKFCQKYYRRSRGLQGFSGKKEQFESFKQNHI